MEKWIEKGRLLYIDNGMIDWDTLHADIKNVATSSQSTPRYDCEAMVTATTRGLQHRNPSTALN